MKTKIIIAVLAFVAFGPALAQPLQTYDNRPKIDVTGEAVVYVKPDKIEITFGAESRDKDLNIAKQKNDDVMKKALMVVKEFGIPDKDIQTDCLSVEPVYRNEDLRQEFIGYLVRNTFVVTLTQTDKVEGLISKVLQSGVNCIHGIDFQTTEFKKYREQARELALKAAKEKAGKMAAVLDRSIGLPINIRENYAGSPWRYYSSWWYGWGGRGQSMSQNVAQNIQDGSGEMADTIALGKIAIRANVSVTFELK